MSPDETTVFQLKPLHADAVPRALEKARQYRALNQPAGAESICRDILEIDPANQDVLATLVLVLTDQFARKINPRFEEAWDVASGLERDYEREYYRGLICERRAKATRLKGVLGSGFRAYEWLRRAMEYYEKAEQVRPEGNDDALLRWNACARVIMQHDDIRPEPEAEPGVPHVGE